VVAADIHGSFAVVENMVRSARGTDSLWSIHFRSIAPPLTVQEREAPAHCVRSILTLFAQEKTQIRTKKCVFRSDDVAYFFCTD